MQLALSTDFTAPMVTLRPHILMVPPKYFCVRYVINPWMESGVEVDQHLALTQWNRLREIISERAKVETFQGKLDLPDMCFSANAGLIHAGTFVPSNFRYAERRPEAEHFTEWMKREGFVVRKLARDTLFEGAGDALFDREGRLWMGYGPRTDLSAASELSALLDTEVIPLALSDPRFYHLDTCFCPLRSGHVVFYPDAFTPQSVDAVRRFIPTHLQIPVTRENALNFACNMVEVGDSVISTYADTNLRDMLKRAGRNVITVDLSEFIKAGGGAKCLTLKLAEGYRSIR
jgi:N-dimethylarginine dimethylaminohydrolase